MELYKKNNILNVANTVAMADGGGGGGNIHVEFSGLQIGTIEEISSSLETCKTKAADAISKAAAALGGESHPIGGALAGKFKTFTDAEFNDLKTELGSIAADLQLFKDSYPKGAEQ